MNLSSARTQLLTWYRKNRRPLPWRATRDPYKIWVSEVMLQQTTVNAVIPYYDKWVKQFPAITDVASAAEQKILKAWQGLGYYSRARNLRKSAQVIVNKHNGRIPENYETLRALPGFGPYTTGAVLSIAFDQRRSIIDANVRRVVMRLLAIKGAGNLQGDREIYAFLDKLLPKKHCGDFNQALMELGALICKSKEPECSRCPVRRHCQAYAQGVQELIPSPVKKNIREITVVIGILEHKGRFFIQQRPNKGLLAGFWEFPGGKVEPKERLTDALKREFLEELRISLTTCQAFARVKHFYTHFKVDLHAYLCNSKSLPKTTVTQKWIKPSDFRKYPFPSGSARIIDKLLGA